VPVPVNHLWILLAGNDPNPGPTDHFRVWPNYDHNVTAIEAYATLLVAFISIVIAYLIYRSVNATNRGVDATNRDVAATRAEVASNLKAIQTSAVQAIAGEILTLGRWLADHPEYGEALRLPADQETETGESVATVHADFMDAVFSQEDLVPDGDVEIWITWFRNRMDMWPQLDKFMRTHLHWYPDYMKRIFPEGDDGSPRTMDAKPSPEQVDKPPNPAVGES
jgi:hypothetical protein